jgi:hypothetical protein
MWFLCVLQGHINFASTVSRFPKLQLQKTYFCILEGAPEEERPVHRPNCKHRETTRGTVDPALLEELRCAFLNTILEFATCSLTVGSCCSQYGLSVPKRRKRN